MKNKLTIIPLLLGILFLAGIAIYSGPADINSAHGDEIEVTIFKSPNCGCCVQHSAYLRKNGFNVKIEEVDNMDLIKARYNIPHEMQSCHTTAMGDYFVEGHVPAEAIKKLLDEKPDIDGITLPGMPSGSPGMPGPKLEPFEIYGLKNGQAELFTIL